MVSKIQCQLHRLLSRHFSLLLYWVPGHVGITGNEKADQAAKSAIQKDLDISAVPTSDIRNSLKLSILSAWQTEWQYTNFKLSRIKDCVRPWASSTRASRREEIILTRLRIGHCHFSHKYLLCGEPSPICDICEENLTVEHVLLHCGKYHDSRRRYRLGSSLKEVLGDDESSLSRLFHFLRDTKLYTNI